MSKKYAARMGLAVIAALLLTLALGAVAHAAEAPAATTTAATATAPAGGEEAAANEGAATEAKGEEKKEIPHTVGVLTDDQKKDLANAWAGMDGYSILIVSILGLGATVGIIGFAAVKQRKA